MLDWCIELYRLVLYNYTTSILAPKYCIYGHVAVIAVGNRWCRCIDVSKLDANWSNNPAQSIIEGQNAARKRRHLVDILKANSLWYKILSILAFCSVSKNSSSCNIQRRFVDLKIQYITRFKGNISVSNENERETSYFYWLEFKCASSPCGILGQRE